MILPDRIIIHNDKNNNNKKENTNFHYQTKTKFTLKPFNFCWKTVVGDAYQGLLGMIELDNVNLERLPKFVEYFKNQYAFV